MPKLERDVKAEIKHLLEVDLAAWHYMPVPNGYGKKGVPDHVACVPLKVTSDMVGATLGVFVGVEAKQLGKDANTHQAYQLDAIRRARGLAFVVKGTEAEDGNFKSVKQTLLSFFRRGI